MNITKNSANSKSILQEYALASKIDLSKIPDNYRKDKDFLRSGKYRFLTPANCNLELSPVQNQTQIQNQFTATFKSTEEAGAEAETIKLSVKNKKGRNKFLNIVKGNTLIIGEDMSEVLDRSIELHRIYLKNNFVTRPISFRDFIRLSFAEQTNPTIHYIVRFNMHDDIGYLTYPLSTMFRNIFFFSSEILNGDEIVGTQIEEGIRSSDIFVRLAMSAAHARKHLLPIFKKDEFLLNDIKTTNKKQKKSVNN